MEMILPWAVYVNAENYPISSIEICSAVYVHVHVENYPDMSSVCSETSWQTDGGTQSKKLLLKFNSFKQWAKNDGKTIFADTFSTLLDDLLIRMGSILKMKFIHDWQQRVEIIKLDPVSKIMKLS